MDLEVMSLILIELINIYFNIYKKKLSLVKYVSKENKTLLCLKDTLIRLSIGV
jgi:hypothetical protein